MTCVECGEIEVTVGHSKVKFCSYECMIKHEGEDYLEIKKCLIHEKFYKQKCDKCQKTLGVDSS